MSTAMATVVVGVLSLFGTLFGAYLANRRSAAILEYRLGQLEKKVDKHNSVVERTYALERRCDVEEEKMRAANRRIEELEQEMNR